MSTISTETRIILRKEFAKHTKSGDCWIEIDGAVYDVSEWMFKHPGGERLLESLGGSDASLPFLLNHHPRIRRLLKNLCIGQLEKREIQPRYKKLNDEFLLLYKQLMSDGWFDTSYAYYAKKACIVLLILISVMIAFYYHCMFYESDKYSLSMALAIIGSITLGMFFQQSAFIGHDLGHNGITHDVTTDSLFGYVVGNLAVGISMGWWKYTHNVHHVRTNDLHYDPDVQHLPFMALDTMFLGSIYSKFHQRVMEYNWFAKMCISVQPLHFLITILMSRIFVLTQSLIFVFYDQPLGKNGKNSSWMNNKLEQITLVLHHIWVIALVSCFTYHPFICFFIAYAIAGILHLQIVINHFPLPLTDNITNDDFILHQALTSMAISSNRWTHWFYGGLQFQVEHHLFPRMPRHNLRKVKPLVQQLFADNDIQYLETSFWGAIFSIQGIMQKVTDESDCKILGKKKEI